MSISPMPLAGKRIVNTRAPHQAAAFDTLLRDQGAIPISYPCIAIIPPDNTHDLDAALRSQFDLLVLTSANTVMIMAERLQMLGLSFQGVSAAAIGAATADAAREQLGIEALTIPDNYSADGLADILPITTGTRILLPQSEIAPTKLKQTFRERGADVIAVSAYQTVRGEGGVELVPLLRAYQIDGVTFTSSSTVRYFTERLHDEGGTITDLAGMAVACIGEQTRSSAEEAGLTVAVTPEMHTLDGMIAALCEYFGRDTSPLEDGHEPHNNNDDD